MLYAIMSTDVENSQPKRASDRPAHLARLHELVDEGRLILAGPHPAVDGAESSAAGFTGSLVVADFPSLEEAQAWADNDPYVAAGVYEKVLVKPFKQVLP